MVLVDEVDFLESSVYLDATTLPRRSSQPTLRVAPGRKRRPGTMEPLHALRHSASMPEIRNPLPATPAALEPNRQSAALAPGPAPAQEPPLWRRPLPPKQRAAPAPSRWAGKYRGFARLFFFFIGLLAFRITAPCSPMCTHTSCTYVHMT